MTFVSDAFEVDGAVALDTAGLVIGRSNVGPWSDYQDAALGSAVIYNRRIYQLVNTPASSASSWKDITNPEHGVSTFFGQGVYESTLGAGTTFYPVINAVNRISITTSTSNAVIQLPTISQGRSVGDALALVFEIDPAVNMSTIPVVVRAATGEYIQTASDTELQLDVRLVSIGFYVKSTFLTYQWGLF